MATLPLWAVGRHITAITLTPQTVNASTGALTDTTPVQTIYGHAQDIEVESENIMENISAMDRQFSNEVIIEHATSYRITELEKYAGANLLAQAVYAFDYFKIGVTRGAQSWTGYAITRRYGMQGQKARVTGQVELAMVDIGGTSANPAYA